VFQRRRDLATVAADTAGGYGRTAPRAVDIDAETATKLRETLDTRLQRALRDRRGERDGRDEKAGPDESMSHNESE